MRHGQFGDLLSNHAGDHVGELIGELIGDLVGVLVGVLGDDLVGDHLGNQLDRPHGQPALVLLRVIQKGMDWPNSHPGDDNQKGKETSNKKIRNSAKEKRKKK